MSFSSLTLHSDRPLPPAEQVEWRRKAVLDPWNGKNARRHFYWTLRARLARDSLLASLENANPLSSFDERLKILTTLVSNTDEPQRLAEDLESVNLEPLLAQLCHQHAVAQVQLMAEKDRTSAIQGFTHLIHLMTSEERRPLPRHCKLPVPGLQVGCFLSLSARLILFRPTIIQLLGSLCSTVAESLR